MKASRQFQKQTASSATPISQTSKRLQTRPFRDPNASTTTQPSQSSLPATDYDPSGRPAWCDRLTFNPQRPSMVQAKLTVGAPNDVYEQEADRVADQVMSMPDAATQHPLQREAMPEEELQTKPLAVAITPLVQREAMPEDEEAVQAKASGNADIQREAMPEDEEVQTKPLASGTLQCEEMPEEDEELQMKSLGTADLQREEMPEEEDALQTKSLGTADLQREEMPGHEEELHTKSLGTADLQREALPQEDSLQPESSPTPYTPHPSPPLETQLSNAQGSGSSLPDDVRSFMEPRFGADFSQVRVHTGSDAVQMNRDLNAQAFTHKQDVYFGAGKAPGNNALTAHELTHVVQQTDEVQVKQAFKQSPIQLKCLACEKETEIQRALDEPSRKSNCGPGSANPFCLPIPPAPDANTPCTPFPDFEAAQLQWDGLSKLIPLGSAIATGCSEVKPVWDTYFAATSTFFPFSNPSSCVVKAAKSESTAAKAADFAAASCFRQVLRNLPVTLQGITSSGSDGTIAERRVPLEEALGPSAPLFVHRPEIGFALETNAAANIVGETGGSDLFGDDDRVIGGTVVIQVSAIDSTSGILSGQVRWRPHIHVKDAADFCPGNLGNFVIHDVIVPMSKLEAMGLTRDVPITIDYDLDDIQQANFNVKPLFGQPSLPPGSIPPTLTPPDSLPPQSESQFRSQRFSGQPTLEACGRGEYRMLVGEGDTEAVEKIQETLGEAGIPVQVNGVYSKETKRAVAKFKREHTPQIIPSDGVVGPQTSHALDDIAVEHGQ